MRHYGIEMLGDFIGEIVSTAPSWTSADEGRLIYAQDTNIFYYGSDTEWVTVGGGAGTGLPLILPDDCSLDDTDDEVSRGSAYSMIQTVDFNGVGDGAIWYSFLFPSVLDDTKDINLDVYYNLDGSDDSKLVTLQTEYWSYGDTSTPNPGAPTGTNSNSISTGVSQDGKRQSYSLDVIPNADITADNTITLKITRLSSDTYSGTFQMMYIYLSQ